MKNKWKGLLAVFLAVMLMAACSVAGAEDGSNPDAIEEIPGEETNEPSINKTADPRLDEDYRATVTMTMPSDAVPLETDVVFVLDKSTSDTVEKQIDGLLDNLVQQVKNTNAIVNVGVVIFNAEANVECELTPLNDNTIQTIKNAVAAEYNSGTNSHSGLLAGINMLKDDTDVSDKRKYLVFISDGITYIFDDGKGNATSILTTEYYNEGKNVGKTSTDNLDAVYMKYPYSTDFITQKGGMEAYLAYVEEMINKDGSHYWGAYKKTSEYGDSLRSNRNGSKIVYGSTDDDFKAYLGDEFEDFVDYHANNADLAIYYTNQAYQTASGIYNCYAMKATTEYSKDHPWSVTLMNWLIGNKAVDFTKIQNDLCHLYGAGTVVTDVMGSGVYTDGKPYDFDFVANADLIKIKYSMLDENNELIVKEYSPEHTETIDGNTYFYFGSEVREKEYDYAFELVYYPNGNDQVKEEHFELTFGRDIKLGEQVQLTYEVELAEACRKTEPGLFDDLLTNEVAYIDPVDSEGEDGERQDFPQPTTEYENIRVYKEWKGNGSVPQSVTINLVNANGQLTNRAITLSENNDWQGDFLNIRKGDYVEEGSLPTNYTVSVKPNGDQKEHGFTVTNTYDAPAPVYDYTTVTITKIWDDNGYGGRPGSIKVKLGVENDPNYEGYTVKLSKDNPNVRIDGNTWTWSATIIDRNYYAEELYVDGYASRVEEVQPNQFVITNTYMPATGDDTPVTRYLLMLGGAALLIAAACVLRARKKA